MLRLAREREDEAGFTLVELVITVSIMGVIMSAITGSIFFMLAAKQRTSAQLATSADRQIVASYFTQDLEAATGPNALSSGSMTVCGVTVASLLTVRGFDYDPGAIIDVPTTVAYVYAAGTRELRRTACRGSSVSSTRTLARSVSAAPTVLGSCSPSAPVSVAATSKTVSLTVPEAGGPSVVLCARRRSS